MNLDEIKIYKEKIMQLKKIELHTKNFPFPNINNNFVLKSVNIDDETIKVKVILSTANYLDSHMDVHIAGNWKKTLKENKNILHLQEHKMTFDHIIADDEDVNVYTAIMNWKDIGFNYLGETEVLIMESIVRKDVNPFMFKLYKQNKVKNHSVGMFYVKLLLAVNDKEMKEEKSNWDTYYPLIVNPEIADEKGYFWVVKESKLIEGSAVVRGSNPTTSTLEVEPVLSTHQKNIIEPDLSTQNDLIEFIKNYKFKINV